MTNQGETNSLLERIKELEANLKEKENQLETSMNTNEDLGKTLSLFASQEEGNRTNMLELEAKLAQRENEINEIRAQFEALTKILKETNESVYIHKRDREENVSEIETLRREKASLEKESVTTWSKIVEMEDQIKSQSQSLNKVIKEKEELEKALKARTKELETIKRVSGSKYWEDQNKNLKGWLIICIIIIIFFFLRLLRLL